MGTGDHHHCACCIGQPVTDCDCATSFLVQVGRTSEYRRAKKIFDHAKFPTFMGRETITRAAREGGLLFFTFNGEDVGVIVNALASAVEPAHQGHGLGSAMIRYHRPNFLRSTEEFVAFHERLGYTAIGEAKQGRKFKTWVMVRSDLINLSGRIRTVVGEKCRCCPHGEHVEPEQDTEHA